MATKLGQFQDNIAAMNENAEHILRQAEDTLDIEHRTILSSYSLLLKGQAVLVEMLLEVLKSQNEIRLDITCQPRAIN